MIYNYTKCESVIAKIMADLDSTEIQLRTSDIKEWIFEAVDKIGAPVLYVQKESGVDGVPVLPIYDGQVPLPIDMEILDGVAYSEKDNGPWVPVDKSTAMFNALHKKFSDTQQVDVVNLTPPHDDSNYAIEEEFVVAHKHLPPAEKMITSLSQLYTSNLAKAALKTDARNIINRPSYFIKPGWLVINRPKGFIKLAYKAAATDERGYPLIPDSATYREAVYWYVVMKLTFPKFLSGQLGGRGVKSAANTYSFVQQLWTHYRNLAYTEAMMPTADDMRNIKHDWNKMIMDYDSDMSFFKHLRDPQTIYNDYYYGY